MRIHDLDHQLLVFRQMLANYVLKCLAIRRANIFDVPYESVHACIVPKKANGNTQQPWGERMFMQIGLPVDGKSRMARHLTTPQIPQQSYIEPT